jgi:hypothetical protein
MKMRIVTTAIILVLGAAAAIAQTNCVPLAMGPPGILFNRAPNWWDASLGEPRFNTNIDAPGWRGAFGLGYPLGTATTEEMHFRALHRAESGKEYIYLSWNGKVAPDITTLNVNKLLVGFTNGAGNPAFEFNVTPDVTSPHVDTQDYTPIVSVNTGGGWGPYAGSPSVPTWIKGTVTPATDGTTRIWIINSPNNQWAVHMRVPVSAIATATNINDGVPIDPSSFKMWFEFRVGAMAAPNGFGFVPYKFPRTIADADPFTDAPPNVAQWGTLHLNSTDTTPDSGCTLDGVGITASDIGTQNVDPHSISLLNPNTFFAAPFNHSMVDVANNVRARFRIANWGNGASWEDVPNPNVTLWKDIGPPSGMPLAGVSIPTNSGVTITLPYDVSSGSATDLCERCQYETYYAANTANCNAQCGGGGANNTKLDHQCLLVELTGPGVNFLNDSVYTNMNFVNASTFTETAEVNLNGLKETSPGSLARTVYFYVERYNMPEVASDPNNPNNPTGITTMPSAINSDMPMAMMVAPEKNPNPAFDVNRPKEERKKELIQLARSRQMSYEEIAHNVPTYVVHAYYDSGIRNTASGTSRPVLRPMQSFGYFVMHDGQPDGWITDLQGATKLAPNWYRIAVPASGIARIKPTIQSVGGPSPTPSSHPYRWFFDIGPNFPHGSFGNFIDGEWSANVGLEKLLSGNNSVELNLGYHLFDTNFGFGPSNPHIWHLSIGGKHYFGTAPWHPFVNGGVGAYRFDPGNTTKAGANGGFGVLYGLSSVWGLEGVYNYHWINTSGSSAKFSTLQIGIRRSF